MGVRKPLARRIKVRRNKYEQPHLHPISISMKCLYVLGLKLFAIILVIIGLIFLNLNEFERVFIGFRMLPTIQSKLSFPPSWPCHRGIQAACNVDKPDKPQSSASLVLSFTVTQLKIMWSKSECVTLNSLDLRGTFHQACPLYIYIAILAIYRYRGISPKVSVSCVQEVHV